MSMKHQRRNSNIQRFKGLPDSPSETEEVRSPVIPPIDLEKDWKDTSKKTDHTGFDYPKLDATEDEKKAFLDSLVGKELYTVRPDDYKIRHVKVFSAEYDPKGKLNLGLQNIDDPNDVFSAIDTDVLFANWSELVINLYGVLSEMLRMNIRNYIVWKGDSVYEEINREALKGLTDALDFAKKQFEKQEEPDECVHKK